MALRSRTLSGTQSRDGCFEPCDLAIARLSVNRAVNRLHLEPDDEEPCETAWRETINVCLQSRLD